MTLIEYVEKLCEDLTTLKNEEWSHCAEAGAYYNFKEGRKYIKVISYDDAAGGGASVVWVRTEQHATCLEGHVLLDEGGEKPAKPHAR